MNQKNQLSNKPDLLKDSIIKLFFQIAVPSSVGTVFMTLYNVVDTFFAGKISAEALAALAQTFPVYFIIIAIGVGLSIGSTSLIFIGGLVLLFLSFKRFWNSEAQTTADTALENSAKIESPAV